MGRVIDVIDISTWYIDTDSYRQF